MTLTEVIQQLCNIRNRVTNTGFDTNIESIDAHIEGDWKGWNIKFHIEKETIDEKKLDELSDNYYFNEEMESSGEFERIKNAYEAGYRKAMEE